MHSYFHRLCVRSKVLQDYNRVYSISPSLHSPFCHKPANCTAGHVFARQFWWEPATTCTSAPLKGALESSFLLSVLWKGLSCHHLLPAAFHYSHSNRLCQLVSSGSYLCRSLLGCIGRSWVRLELGSKVIGGIQLLLCKSQCSSKSPNSGKWTCRQM